MRKTQVNNKLYTKVLNAIDKFFNSDFYIATFALCVFLSWFWECEYIAVGVAIISLCYMFLTQQYLDRLIPIAIMICAMVDNNMRHRLSMSKLVVLICLLLVVVGCAVYHFLKVHKKSERKLKSSTLFLGFLTASIAGFLGGIGYEGQTIGLSLMVGGCGLAFLGLYLLLYKCTDDKSKDTVVKSIIALCFIIVAEVMVALIRSGDALALSASKWMSLGWAITNSVASVLAIGIPLCFYMASKHKFQLGYMFSATLFLLFIFLTNCRSMMLAGAVVYCICIVLSFIKLNRWQSLINVAVLIVVGLIAYCTIFDEMFSRFIKYGLDGTGREEIYVTY
ncbi:MAG: hypothetical protein J6J23_05835, partial [Clostridia bacterium]|nr:hypothetical protein [Clostridia bacterium]